MTSNKTPSHRSLEQLVRRYDAAFGKLAKARREMFPTGSAVTVDAPSYHGAGFVASDGDCPVHKLPVRLENGNVWWYPLVACTPNAQAEPLPPDSERGR